MEQIKKLQIQILSILLVILQMISLTKASIFNVICHEGTNYTQEKTPFQTNLLTALSRLNTASTTAHFQTTTSGTASDKVYAAFMCRYDLPLATCHYCVKNARLDLEAFCPYYWEASSLYKYCAVQYSNQSLFSRTNGTLDYGLACDKPDFPDPLLRNTVQLTISELIDNVTKVNASGKYYFVTGEKSYMKYQKVHGLVQCAPDFSTSSCWNCLRDAMYNVLDYCNATLGGKAVGVGCSVTYSLYSFYNNTSDLLAPPPSPSSQTLPTGNSSPDFGPGVLSIAQLVFAYLLMKGLTMMN